ncbi:hypothetical protein C8E87_0620 [Paractinoplanes brasiliensis]|uniref:Acetyltransferase (GNAT) family protein n=1 Tax=Paractinoplanes brasiliensis TaxID=52695 RepID=A0A4R6JME2_9ACTN|nr:hypothetical protein C8E87_0620 [Actinoplanes brasiliensis]
MSSVGSGVTDNLETRPWKAADLTALRAAEPLFPPDTYPRRFIAGSRQLRPLHRKVEHRLAEPEHRWTGQVALTGDRLVALAECSWDPADPGTGTLAVNVAEAWRSGALGYRVLHELVGRCVRLGITTFDLDYAASNIALQSAIDAIATETGVRYTLSGVTRAGIGHLTVRAEH